MPAAVCRPASVSLSSAEANDPGRPHAAANDGPRLGIFIRRGGPTPEENFPETEDACRNARDVSECEALVALHESKDEASVAKALAQGELPEADIDTTAQTEPELSVCV